MSLGWSSILWKITSAMCTTVLSEEKACRDIKRTASDQTGRLVSSSCHLAVALSYMSLLVLELVLCMYSSTALISLPVYSICVYASRWVGGALLNAPATANPKSKLCPIPDLVLTPPFLQLSILLIFLVWSQLYCIVIPVATTTSTSSIPGLLIWSIPLPPEYFSYFATTSPVCRSYNSLSYFHPYSRPLYVNLHFVWKT